MARRRKRTAEIEVFYMHRFWRMWASRFLTDEFCDPANDNGPPWSPDATPSAPAEFACEAA